MRVTVTAKEPGTARGKVFVGPYNLSQPTGQTGSLIVDDSGNPVWFRPLSYANLQNADFRVQGYHNPRTGRTQPVLTWWQGSLAIPPWYTNLPGGAPEPGGCYYIYDNHYRLLRTVFARHGFNADEHEFLLTRRGTALFIASKPVPMDLTPYGGPKNGAIEDSEVQEVDLATGRLVFSWDMLQHVNPADSEVPASDASSSGGVWDAYHMNSIDEGPKGQLLVSARDMWAVYDISERTGKIRWQLGGRKSDFAFGPNADFFWQHDVRFRPGNRISMFDDGCCNLPNPPEQQSHGLVLKLNFRSHQATSERTYYHAPALYSASQGDNQALPNGDKFIGWGQESYYSEYAGAGNTEGDGSQNLLYDAQMPGSDISYRAFRYKWVGEPCYPPSAAARAIGGRSIVYASWNGSTETRAWQLLAGPNAGSLSVVARHAGRTGFETAVTTTNAGPYFQVRALDGNGKVLGISDIVTLSG
ncbi:arylsulfotransferase family protein [Streptantibioticus ferralitis]|uniref:Arylsulfotransferase family protein n=1 Tax=Streptantibioticus ferralitis TaxID=236510 RepID=A0ABT5Z2N6_9ACTN|nr:arylsulfotransferase family protein [Streptantibioticus ferralitis]MDF2257295.1 arylsulfotransferase family protein [Streptantibioticus ferralitis]